MKNKTQQTTGWLDNFNDSKVSLPTGFVGEGTINGPQWNSPAWGGQFQDGGSIKQGQDFVKNWMSAPETRKRYRANMSGQPTTDKSNLSVDNEVFQSGLENLWNTTYQIKGEIPGTHGQYNMSNIDFYGQPSIGTSTHEFTHGTGDLSNNLSKYLMQDSGPLKSIRDKHGLDTVGSVKKEFGQLNAQNRIDHASYMGQNGELYPRIMEMRQFLNVKPGQPIDDNMIERLMKDEKTGETARYYTPKKLKDILNTVADNSNHSQDMGYAQNGGEMKYYQEGLDFQPKGMKDGGWLGKYAQEGDLIKRDNTSVQQPILKQMKVYSPEAGQAANSQSYRDGGVIKDDRGQWEHPGEITEIGSNQITMQGVPYPVLGISDTGDKQMMYPGQDYSYKGSKVTEYPMAQDGKELQKLNQLVNFTNYNKPQPGGWLNKYIES